MARPDPTDFQSEGFGDLYDELPLWSAPFGLVLLERVPLRDVRIALDLGAGTGWLTVELAQRCGASTRVIAVDSWHAAATRLRWKVDVLGLRNVTVLEQDAAELELPGGSVDLIVSNLGFHNFADPDAVLRTAHRVSCGGGRFLATTNLVGHMAELYEQLEAALVDVGERERLGDLREHVASRGTAEEHAERLDRAGFRVRRVSTFEFPWRFADADALLGHAFIRLGFLPAWLGLVPESARDALLDRLRRRLDALAGLDDGISLTIPGVCLEALRRPGPA